MSAEPAEALTDRIARTLVDGGKPSMTDVRALDASAWHDPFRCRVVAGGYLALGAVETARKWADQAARSGPGPGAAWLRLAVAHAEADRAALVAALTAVARDDVHARAVLSELGDASTLPPSAEDLLDPRRWLPELSSASTAAVDDDLLYLAAEVADAVQSRSAGAPGLVADLLERLAPRVPAANGPRALIAWVNQGLPEPLSISDALLAQAARRLRDSGRGAWLPAEPAPPPPVEPPPVAPPPAPPPVEAGVRVQVSARASVNFALLHAGVPLVQAVRVENRGEARLTDAAIALRLEPEIRAEVVQRLDVLHPGESVTVDRFDLRVPAAKLRTLLEAEQAELAWELRRGDERLASGTHPVEVLAWNEWPGASAPSALLAVFVTPNHPAVASVLKQVAERLQRDTGDAALNDYQSRSEERVLAVVRALYDTVQEMGVTYVTSPASFESSGQKVRLAEMVLEQKLGNCLDVSVLFASCLEQMGLHPLVVLVPGHAFPGVWLVDDQFREVVVHDGARLRTSVELGQLVFFDSSAAVASPRIPFDASREIARRALQRDDLIYAVDVSAARREKWRPLPVRALATSAVEEAEDLALATPLVEAPATTAPAPEAPRPADPLEARLDAWRRRLLDLSLRNKLLNFRDGTKTALPLAVPDLARFEDGLAQDEVFTLQPRAPIDPRDERDPRLVTPEHERELAALRLQDFERKALHVELTEADLLGRAVTLDRTARSDLEEGGANTLFAAIGFLKWYETESTRTPRYAPLLLVPVVLDYSRQQRVVRVRRLAEDPLPNQTLHEKLVRDFAVDLGLQRLASDEAGIDVPQMLEAARRGIQRVPRWEILETAALGLFAFGKYLLWKDLADNSEVLLQSEVVRHIALGREGSFRNPAPQTRPGDIDRVVRPADLPLPIDADSSQIAAVHSALAGNTFVLQGPPGTGKSQTITNLISAAVAAGKTVLFVAEKRAALEVVHRRLEQAGLADFCLELHSNKANKKDVVASLAATLERRTRTVDPGGAVARQLEEARDGLNGYTAALHRVHPIGESFYRVSARVLPLRTHDVPRVTLPIPRPLDLTSEEWEARAAAARRFADNAAEVEPATGHPWREVTGLEWSATREGEIRGALDEVLAAHEPAVSAAERLGAALKLGPALGAAGLGAQVGLGEALSKGPAPRAGEADGAFHAWAGDAEDLADALDAQAARRAQLQARWTDEVLKVDVARLLPRFQRWADQFFLLAWVFLFFARRELAPALRGRASSRQIRDDLAVVQQTKDASPELERRAKLLARELGDAWTAGDGAGLRELVTRSRRLRTQAKGMELDLGSPAIALASPDAPAAGRERAGRAAAEAGEALARWTQRWEALARALALDPALGATFGVVHERATRWRAEIGALRTWGLYVARGRELEACGLGPIAEAHRAGAFPAADVERVTAHSVLGPWVDAARDADPVLKRFDGREHHRRVEDFRRLDQAQLAASGAAIRSRLEQGVPDPTAAAESSEPWIVMREAKKKTRIKAVRTLLQEIPTLLPRLKPCLLMSPLSVAQYLPAGGRKFDLVVFDEASQIATHEAIGALARGAQVVVVGDSKQLPPTTFFQRSADDGEVDENDFDELESILEEAQASGIPAQSLEWHYRSRHESLINFSNTHFYEDRLNVFPAARSRVEDLGIRWYPVKGTFDRGGSRTNRVEAEAVVGALVERLRATAPGTRTYGVVTLSQAQQTLVSDLLDDARRLYPEIEGHFAGITEPVFVKNLENVQGDERDEILFSVGYGPEASGKIYMNFGPLNREGGERRLNVAVTRARAQLRVFSSLTADQIDLGRTKARGAQRLQEFLRYAQSQGSPAAEAVGQGDFDSDFERQVHDALVAHGYRVHTQVGCRGYRIDLAVVHPERPGEYVLAVECDGAAYHAAATARDRDRLRQQVLENQGWRVHRIWSTDWWFERKREIDRLAAAVREAIAAPPPKVSLPVAPPIETVAAAPAASGEGYTAAALAPISDDPEHLYEAAFGPQVAAAVAEVVRAEGPVHVDVIVRRVVGAFGGKATSRARERVLTVGRGAFVRRGEFAWPPGLDPEAWDRVRSAPMDVRDVEEVPPEELRAAVLAVLRASLAVPRDVLVREVGRRLGVQRTGARVEEVIGAGVDDAIGRGHARADGERVVLA